MEFIDTFSTFKSINNIVDWKNAVLHNAGFSKVYSLISEKKNQVFHNNFNLSVMETDNICYIFT